MDPLLVIAFLLGLVAVVAAIGTALGNRTPKIPAVIYMSLVGIAVVVCAFTTFRYTYFANSNIQVSCKTGFGIIVPTG